jgi:hypothetical protein
MHKEDKIDILYNSIYINNSSRYDSRIISLFSPSEDKSVDKICRKLCFLSSSAGLKTLYTPLEFQETNLPKTKWPENLKDITSIAIKFENYDVLPLPITKNLPANWHENDFADKIMQLLNLSKYQRIIINAPCFTDDGKKISLLPLINQADKAFLVISGAKTKYSKYEETLKKMNLAKNKLHGVIINDYWKYGIILASKNALHTCTRIIFNSVAKLYKMTKAINFPRKKT